MPRRDFPGTPIMVQFPQNQNQPRNRGPGGPGGRTQRTCHICNRPGHLAKDCRNAQNNNGGNANGPQNQNGRGPRQNNGHNGNANSNSNRPRVDPSRTQPNDDCYMHAGKGHKNSECKSNKNIWFSKPANIGQPQPPQGPRISQQQAPRPRHQFAQQNGVLGYVGNRGALSGADFEYCERCNRTGHIAIRCEQPAIKLPHMVCHQCKNRGHCHTDCRHPAFCKNCKKTGHPAYACNAPPAFETLLGPNEAKRREMDTLSAQQILRPGHAHFPAPAHFPTPAQVFPYGITTVLFANPAGEIINGAPLNEVQEDLATIASERETRYRQAIADKCCRAHARYSMSHLNKEILAGADLLRRVDPMDPHITLPSQKVATEALERLMKHWIDNNSFWNAAAMIKMGWNFFRDPRVLDAIARNSKPVCHCCSREGHIFSVTFKELLPGTDVLTVEDFDDWGPSVAFRCQCSLNGYSFLQAADEPRMDFSQ